MKRSLPENIREIDIPRQVEGIRVGKVVSVDDSGRVLVDFPGNTQGPVSARFTNSTKLEILRQAASAGKEVLLVFENNNSELPIIIDTIYSLVDQIMESPTVVLDTERPKDVMVDGKRVAFDAREEIVLRCGKASITLTRAGRVIIRGAHVLSRSSSVNRIQGGSVRIN